MSLLREDDREIVNHLFLSPSCLLTWACAGGHTRCTGFLWRVCLDGTRATAGSLNQHVPRFRLFWWKVWNDRVCGSRTEYYSVVAHWATREVGSSYWHSGWKQSLSRLLIRLYRITRQLRDTGHLQMLRIATPGLKWTLRPWARITREHS